MDSSKNNDAEREYSKKNYFMYIPIIYGGGKNFMNPDPFIMIYEHFKQQYSL